MSDPILRVPVLDHSEPMHEFRVLDVPVSVLPAACFPPGISGVFLAPKNPVKLFFSPEANPSETSVSGH